MQSGQNSAGRSRADVAKTARLIRYWRKHPVDFVCDAFDFGGLVTYNGSPISEPTAQQRKIIESVRDNKFTHVMSGTTIGKTSVLAWIVFWFLTVYYHPLIVVTSVNNVLLNDVFWSELTRWFGRCRLRTRYKMNTHDKHLWVRGQKKESFCVAKSSERSAEQKDTAMSGLHASNMLFIIDEAAGVPYEIWEQLIGSCAGYNNKMICTSNPVKKSGMFFDIVQGMRDTWNCLRFSSLDSPLYDPALADKIAETHGEDSDLYRVRVLGEFPKGGGDNVLISLDKTMECVHNVVRDEMSGIGQIGVDVARMGSDLTVITVVKGNVVLDPIVQEKTSDFFRLANLVIREIRKNKIKLVKIDATGMGEGLVDILSKLISEQHIDCRVMDVKFGGAAFNRREYHDNIAEMWSNAKQMIDAGEVALPEHGNLIKQLTSREYSIDSTGRIQIESKKDYKKRMKRSPDFADSLILALYNRRKNYDVEVSATGSSMFA